MAQSEWLSRNLIFVTGKGGVGKTTLAQATAQDLAKSGKKVLLAHVLQLTELPQKLEQIDQNLWSVTLNASDCFKEYIALKLKLKPLVTAFLGNKVTQYLERAAPGVREMVILGKIWFERQNYDHVVVDMPSTGYALTMIHTPFNFAALFPGGPIYHDATEMVRTLGNPDESAFVTVCLAEEMPIQESLELAHSLKALMPRNPSWLVVNRLVRVAPKARELYQRTLRALTAEQNPLWQALAYRVGREDTQTELLSELKRPWKELWAKGPSDAGSSWLELDEIPSADHREIVAGVAKALSGKPGLAPEARTQNSAAKRRPVAGERHG